MLRERPIVFAFGEVGSTLISFLKNSKRATEVTLSLLCKDYKIDIFIGLEYDFELLQKMIYRWRDMIYGWCRMIYILRKYDIISVPTYAKRISSEKQIS